MKVDANVFNYNEDMFCVIFTFFNAVCLSIYIH